MSDKLAEGVNLDTNGAVVFTLANGPYSPICGMMHPYSFRDLFGEDAYQELLARPRVQSEFTKEELSQ